MSQRVTKAMITKFHRDDTDIHGMPRLNRGYRWKVTVYTDAGTDLPFGDYPTRDEAEGRIGQLAVRCGYPIPIRWDEDSHFSLAMAPDYVPGTLPKAEAAHDEMMGRVDEWERRHGGGRTGD